jgi:hypothetical protein
MNTETGKYGQTKEQLLAEIARLKHELKKRRNTGWCGKRREI